jgi:hypothetical protein
LILRAGLFPQSVKLTPERLGDAVEDAATFVVGLAR